MVQLFLSGITKSCAFTTWVHSCHGMSQSFWSHWVWSLLWYPDLASSSSSTSVFHPCIKQPHDQYMDVK
jgi:hypothetical protein